MPYLTLQDNHRKIISHLYTPDLLPPPHIFLLLILSSRPPESSALGPGCQAEGATFMVESSQSSIQQQELSPQPGCARAQLQLV